MEKSTAIQKHEREVRRQIIFPMVAFVTVLVIGAIVLFVSGVTGTFTGDQIGVVAICLSIICILLPMVVVLLFVDALALLVIFSVLADVGSFQRLGRNALDAIRGLTEQVSNTTTSAAEQITNPVIGWRAQLAQGRHFIGRLLGIPTIKDIQDNGKETTEF